ncbi:TIGR00730 family Rossman fold protein [Bdellovibrio sp. HCB117]|uniref:LOG family protein n=1 Tax=Bdellovibrio sp. HCB117 TaxID=3394359 RepID=UPI0039B50C3C
MKKICVFCGSSSGVRPEYLEMARELGKTFAMNGIALVYGGAKIGLMGAMADSCLAHGGKVIGVIPQVIMQKEVAHTGLTDLQVVDSMHTRKARMAELADAFIALPGGFGTFEELCEIVTWAQLGLHQKPIGVLDVHEFYKPLKELIESGMREGFIRDEYKGLVVFANSPDDILNKFASYTPVPTPQWIKSTAQT